MKRTNVALLVVLMISVLAFYGCPKKTEMSATPEEEAQKVEAAPTAPADEAARQAEAEAAAKQAEQEEQERAAREAAGLQPVYFDFDQSAVRSDARDVLKANAEWLKANPDVKIRIEGNCDERGTIEYNQALGQRRASAAKKYLANLGIKSSRIKLISYGKERPSCTESTEDCWQQNRRDDFVAE
jgi:peptidoglycan-associated lipoprotein